MRRVALIVLAVAVVLTVYSLTVDDARLSGIAGALCVVSLVLSFSLNDRGRGHR